MPAGSWPAPGDYLSCRPDPVQLLLTDSADSGMLSNMGFPLVIRVLTSFFLLGLSTASTLRQCLLTAVQNDPTLVAVDGDLLYQTLAVQVYNLNWPVTPAAVTFPKSTQQVASIVSCAATLGYKVQAKSGGHSYGNYGTSSLRLTEWVLTIK